MLRVMRWVHLTGVLMFLGSVVGFAFISALTEDATLAERVSARETISTGMYLFTLPGMWLMGVSGVWLALVGGGLPRRLVMVKLALISLITANAYLIIVPAADAATQLAAESLAEGRLLPAYQTAYLTESMYGAANVVLAVGAVAIGLWSRRRPARISESLADSLPKERDLR